MTENNGFIGNPESGIDQFLNSQFESASSADKESKMTTFTVSIPLVSYYEVEIEAESEIEARLAVTRFLPSDITDDGNYTGWDIDFSNLGVAETETL
jgi:hypothetical protein